MPQQNGAAPPVDRDAAYQTYITVVKRIDPDIEEVGG